MLAAKRTKPVARRESLHANSDPLVTIAIPTFNRASWLKDCVLSALSQTYKNFEVIVSDNASTDDTQKVLREFRSRKLRIITQSENIGLLPNWNACLAEAKGDYIVLVSDDDRISSWLLKRAMGLVKTDPSIPIVITLSDIYYSEVARTWTPSTRLNTGVWNGVDILTALLQLPMLAGMSTFMIRTKELRNNGGFPLDRPHSADLAVWAPLLFAGTAGFVKEPCGILCLHSANQTSRMAINLRLSDGKKVIDQLIDMADRSVKDPQKCREVKFLSRRFFARSTFSHISQYRREGARLAEVLPLFWRWRRELKNVGVGYIFKMSSLLSILLLPVRVAGWSRRFRRTYRLKHGLEAPIGLRLVSTPYPD